VAAQVHLDHNGDLCSNEVIYHVGLVATSFGDKFEFIYYGFAFSFLFILSFIDFFMQGNLINNLNNDALVVLLAPFYVELP